MFCVATKLISQPVYIGKIQENNTGQIFGLEGPQLGFGKMRASCALGAFYIPNPDQRGNSSMLTQHHGMGLVTRKIR